MTRHRYWRRRRNRGPGGQAQGGSETAGEAAEGTPGSEGAPGSGSGEEQFEPEDSGPSPMEAREPQGEETSQQQPGGEGPRPDGDAGTAQPRRRRRRRRSRGRGPQQPFGQPGEPPQAPGEGSEPQAVEGPPPVPQQVQAPQAPQGPQAPTAPAGPPSPGGPAGEEGLGGKHKRRRRHRHRAGRHARRRGRGGNFPPEGPPEPQKNKPKFAGSWWADRWIKMLESFGHSNRLPRGRYYARTGRVFDFRVGPGEVTAKVQGSRPQPYNVRIEVTPLDERAWYRVIEAMAQQAVFAAKMLSGEMPQNIGEVFASASVSLFPKMARDLRMNCSCPDSVNLCKHAVAVNYILAEAFDGDPFILLHLRGRSRDEVIDALTRHRARLIATESGQPADGSAGGAGTDLDGRQEEGPPATDPYAFYELSHGLEDLQFVLETPPVPHAVIASLGPPPTHNPGQAEAVLASCYALISQQALDAAFGRESEEPAAGSAAPVPSKSTSATGPSITSTQVSLKSIRE